MTAAITGLEVIVGDSSSIQAPPGFTKIPVDLNKGAGGKYINLCFKRDSGSPITGLTVILGQNTLPPSGYKKIPKDLNQGARAKGEYIYLCYKEGSGVPILDIVFQSTSTDDQYPPRGYDGISYSQIAVDLNKDAKGNYIYLYYLAKNPDESPNLNNGIKAEMLANPDREYEISRVQIDEGKELVRIQKLEVTNRKTIGATVPWKYTQEVTRGTQKSEVTSLSVEVGISASASYGVFSAEINTKLGYSTTSSFTTSEETKTTEQVDIPAADYSRTFAFCTAIDVLRVVAIPSGNTISQLVSRTPNYGIFVTNRQGLWEDAKKTK